ncbi:MAG: hypothetical protein AB7L90_26530, partial [Hyphomicrobiaceae bacterium]
TSRCREKCRRHRLAHVRAKCVESDNVLGRADSTGSGTVEPNKNTVAVCVIPRVAKGDSLTFAKSAELSNPLTRIFRHARLHRGTERTWHAYGDKCCARSEQEVPPLEFRTHT